MDDGADHDDDDDVMHERLNRVTVLVYIRFIICFKNSGWLPVRVPIHASSMVPNTPYIEAHIICTHGIASHCIALHCIASLHHCICAANADASSHALHQVYVMYVR